MKKREPRKKDNNDEDYNFISDHYKELKAAKPSFLTGEGEIKSDTDIMDFLLLVLGPPDFKDCLDQAGGLRTGFDDDKFRKAVAKKAAEKQKTKNLLKKITSLEENGAEVKKGKEKKRNKK